MHYTLQWLLPAEYLSCSQRIYSNYERGEVNIPVVILIKLADLHQTSTDYLLNRTNHNNPYPKS
ncbi:MAG TPA: transcriptional regulator [Paenibacillus sp.]|nr:transcriptional regulator [Paenibacillus sp.]